MSSAIKVIGILIFTLILFSLTRDTNMLIFSLFILFILEDKKE